MEWTDTGILLGTRKHGESALIIDVFTPSHGVHSGVLPGGTSRKKSAFLQPGAQLRVAWRARLEAHLGSFSVEPERSRAAAALSSRMALAGLSSVTALLGYALPERQAYPKLYHATEQLLDLLGQDEVWSLAYLNWEVLFLEELGFGLDLHQCAVTGATEGLAFVSPRTGRAVTAKAAGAWADRLLPLPNILRGIGPGPDHEIRSALEVTGHFINHYLAQQLGDKPLPQARANWIALLDR